MNDLTPVNTGTAVAIHSETNFFTEAGESGNTIIGTLLKFKKGDYFAGQDNDEVAVGTKFIVDVDNYLWGWIRWWDNKPSKQILGRISDGHKPEARSDLGDHIESDWETDDRGDPKDPWQETHYVFLKDPEVEGEEGLYTFTVSSASARNSMKKFLKSYGGQMRQHLNEFPVIELRVGYWDSDDYGRIKFPEFKIVGWTPKGGFETEDAGQEEIPFDVEPKKAAPATQAKAAGKTRF